MKLIIAASALLIAQVCIAQDAPSSGPVRHEFIAESSASLSRTLINRMVVPQDIPAAQTVDEIWARHSLLCQLLGVSGADSRPGIYLPAGNYRVTGYHNIRFILDSACPSRETHNVFIEDAATGVTAAIECMATSNAQTNRYGEFCHEPTAEEYSLTVAHLQALLPGVQVVGVNFDNTL